MTLKTLTGPSIREALADARRLFGPDVVMLQSAPAAAGAPASVTVAFDDTTRTTAPARPAPEARPAPAAAPAPRAYGYPAVRKTVPSAAEPISAPPPPPVPAPPMPPPASASEVDTLKARLADLEGELASLRRAAPPPVPAAPALVFVGPAGGGKTSLALRMAQRPDLLSASTPAALVVAPEDGPFLDPAPLFWAAGVPVVVVRTADDVAEALHLFEGADRIVVDTPTLSLRPERARAQVARLGALLAPLGTVEVLLTLEETRSPDTFNPMLLSMIGLKPDGLALTRLDEARCPQWLVLTGLDMRIESYGPTNSDLSISPVLSVKLPRWAPLASLCPRPDTPLRERDLRALVASVTHCPTAGVPLSDPISTPCYV